MQVLRTVFIGAALALAVSANAETASGPSVGHPLSPLCDMICGGTWEPPTAPYPDEIRTTMTFAWDTESNSIKGTSIRMGGIAGIRQVTHVNFAYDAATDTITTERIPDEANSTKIEGQDRSLVRGTVTLSGNGFQTRIESPTIPGDMMLTAVLFETPDLWVERSEIIGSGQSTLGAELRYARTP